MPRRQVDLTDVSLADAWRLPPLTIEQVRGLPVSCPLPFAARACDIGRTRALEMARQGALEYMGRKVPVRKVGKRLKVALPDLLAALGVPMDPPADPAA